MTQLIRMAALALTAALCVPALSQPAEARGNYTIYKDNKVDADLAGSIKIKASNTAARIEKLTLKVTCEDGSKEKVVRKDIRVVSGTFETFIGSGQSIKGLFDGGKIEGKFRTALCGFFGGSYSAKK